MTVAVIPARGGSRGVPRKNLRLVGGVPLVVRTVRAALAAERTDRVLVSTDDPEIAAVAARAGAEVVNRPETLAGPEVTVSAVVEHALAWADHDGGPVVVLQPSSPFTTGDLIDAVLWEAEEGNGGGNDSAETVTAVRHALWTSKPEPLHRLAVNRQVATVVAYRPTGAVRACRSFPQLGAVGGDLLCGDTHALVDPAELGMDPEKQAVDIDTAGDLAHARDLATRGSITFAVAVGRAYGMGHLHRCLTLADELAHHEVRFRVCGDADDLEADRLIKTRGYLTGRSYPTTASVVVFDTLELFDERAVINARAGGSRVAVLECLDRPTVAAADLAVNALYDQQTGYASAGALVGPGWEPLRPEFHTAAPVEPTDGRRLRVLVTFGGTDPAELTERFVMLSEGTVYRGWAANPEVRTLWPPGRPLLDDPAWACWEGAVSEAMAWADVVVCSAGRTVLEAAAVRRPALVITSHEREEHHARLPGTVWLGHHAGLTDAVFQSNLRWLLDHPDERDARAARAHGAVDPAGATVRLADLLDRLVRG